MDGLMDACTDGWMDGRRGACQCPGSSELWECSSECLYSHLLSDSAHIYKTIALFSSWSVPLRDEE
jgi:hypothetical protein